MEIEEKLNVMYKIKRTEQTIVATLILLSATSAVVARCDRFIYGPGVGLLKLIIMRANLESRNRTVGNINPYLNRNRT